MRNEIRQQIIIIIERVNGKWNVANTHKRRVPSDLNHLRWVKLGKKAKISHRVQCYFSGNFDGPPDSLLAIQISFLFFFVILHLFIALKSIARIGIFLILFLAKIFCSALQLLILLLLLPMYLLSFKEVYVYVQTLPFLSIYFTAVIFLCYFFFCFPSLCVCLLIDIAKALSVLVFVCSSVVLLFFLPPIFFSVFAAAAAAQANAFFDGTRYFFWIEVLWTNIRTKLNDVYIHSRFCTWKPKAREN